MTYEIPKCATKKQAEAIARYNNSFSAKPKKDPEPSCNQQKNDGKASWNRTESDQFLVCEGQKFRTEAGGSTIYEFGPRWRNGNGPTRYTYRKAYSLNEFTESIDHCKLKSLINNNIILWE